MILLARRGTPAVFLAMAALAACAGGPQGTVETAPLPASASQTSDSLAIARARADSMRHPYTEADVHFMTSMIGHHAQAIVMASLAPTRAESEAVKTLAERVINGQRDEIRTMQQWLRDRRKPVPEPDLTGGAMGHGGMNHGTEHGGSHGATAHATHDSSRHAAHHPTSDSARAGASHPSHQGAGHLMPGMLTAEQMTQLRAARGAEFDRLFLSYMIQHHRGAVAMVEQLFGTYGAAQDEAVFKFASDVNVDQITEIARMERMLRALLFEVPAP